MYVCFLLQGSSGLSRHHLFINNTRGVGDEQGGKWGNRLQWETMLVREYMYTFIHGQPAFTEVTLIVNRRLRLSRHSARGHVRRPNKGTNHTLLRCKKAMGRRVFVNKRRRTRRTDTFFINQTTTQQQPQTEALRGSIHTAAMFWRIICNGTSRGRVFDLSLFGTSSRLRGAMINMSSRMRDGLCVNALDELCNVKNNAECAIPSVPCASTESTNQCYQPIK